MVIVMSRDELVAQNERLSEENETLRHRLALVCALTWDDEAGRSSSLSGVRVSLISNIVCSEDDIVERASEFVIASRQNKFGNHMPDIEAIRIESETLRSRATAQIT